MLTVEASFGNFRAEAACLGKRYIFFLRLVEAWLSLTFSGEGVDGSRKASKFFLSVETRPGSTSGRILVKCLNSRGLEAKATLSFKVRPI